MLIMNNSESKNSIYLLYIHPLLLGGCQGVARGLLGGS